MFEFPTKKPGDRITAKDWNMHSTAIQELLAASSRSSGGKQSVGSTTVFQGGKMWDRETGFTIRSVTKKDDNWVAYFNPGVVCEIALGAETMEHIPEIDGQAMDGVPYPSLNAEDGDVYLVINIDEDGNVDTATIQIGKGSGDSPWKTRTVEDGEPGTDESGCINILLGKFETVGDSIRYSCRHAGDVTIMRPGLKQKLVNVPDSEFSKMDGTELATGSGIFKPICNIDGWENWFSPLIVGPGLKIEKEPDEASELRPYYKLKGDGFGKNGTITFRGYESQHGNISVNELVLRLRDGFIKDFTGGDWTICADGTTELMVYRTDSDFTTDV